MEKKMNEKFATNLQFYRRRMDLTQEQLAERLEVSRQSISKWEAGAAFPEMDKLMKMCEMFSCPMDTLLRGDAEVVTADDALGYDRYMRRFSYIMSAGTGLMFLSAPVLLALLGFGVQVAIAVVSMLAFFIAGIMVMVCSGMGDEEYRKKNPTVQPFYTEDQMDTARRRFRVGMTAFIGLLFGSALFIVGSYAFPEPPNASRLVYWAVFALILTIAIVGLQLTGMLYDRYNIEQYNKNNASKKADR
jgi:transcriptional regulator with XRE-family HTH domain